MTMAKMKELRAQHKDANRAWDGDTVRRVAIACKGGFWDVPRGG